MEDNGYACGYCGDDNGQHQPTCPTRHYTQVIDTPTNPRQTAPVSFVVKDSGKRQEYASGMVRDVVDDKPDYERLFQLVPMFDRVADHLTKAAAKYQDDEDGNPNWQMANSMEECRRARKSLLRHVRQLMRGDTDEDHAAAVIFNVNLMEYARLRAQGIDPREPKA